MTNFVVRKCAHFTEYMVLGILATHAFDFEGRRTFDVLLPTAVFLLLIPSIDETIQLFGAGTRRHDHRCDDRLLWSGNGRCAPISLTAADARQKSRLGRIVCPRRPFLFEGLYEAWWRRSVGWICRARHALWVRLLLKRLWRPGPGSP